MKVEISSYQHPEIIAPPTPYAKIKEYNIFLNEVATIKNNGLKLVLTTGVYDIFHFKHAESLLCISQLGDYLAVGIPDDDQVVKAATLGIQPKDTKGPIVEFNKRAMLVAHLPYVNAIFKKTSDKLTLIQEIKPNVLVQSITSGKGVIDEVTSLCSFFNYSFNNGNLVLDLGENFCEIKFIDDIYKGQTQIIPFTDVMNKSEEWEKSKFSEDKFSGSIIKSRIIQRVSNRTLL
jgi:glycerol-3-phosphate cytidylyltransferase-like family protein